MTCCMIRNVSHAISNWKSVERCDVHRAGSFCSGERRIGQSDRWSQNINLWMWFCLLLTPRPGSTHEQYERHRQRRNIHKASIFRKRKKGEWNEILLILDTSMFTKRSCKEILRELQHRNYDNTPTVRYIQISTPTPAHPRRYSLLRLKGMTFLIKLYDDDKKVLKIYFQPHKLCEKVFSPRPSGLS